MEKTRGFQLRSGNKPSGFKMMGSSPLNIVPVVNPSDENNEDKENKEVNVTETDASNITDNIVVQPKVNKTKTIASKIGNTLVGAFTSGLDAVYGSGKVIPGDKVKFHDPKKKKEEERKFGDTALDDDKTT
tara:strand:+ start:195 stop:587 length:393 start_codon:yes stop_codon:yes gene_type:complete